MAILILVVILVLGTLGALLYARKTPMEVCLTFEDGVKEQFSVAAPSIERYGWHAAFGIPTSWIGQAVDKFTCMDAEELKALARKGHAVCPCTVGFVDLVKTHAKSPESALVEIRDSIKAVKEATGVLPELFSLPYDSCNPAIADLIKAQGLMPMQGHRESFPKPRSSDQVSITEFMRSEYAKGTRHIDLVMRGIVKAKGGRDPFQDAPAFDRFCDALKALENSRFIKIVPYKESHVVRPKMDPFLDFLRTTAFSVFSARQQNI